MKRIVPIICCLLIPPLAQAQSNQEKAQGLAVSYLAGKSNLKSNPNIKFNPIRVSRSSYADTKQYKNYLHKIDSLKIAGRRIDARIAKMKTTAELSQAKKDSNRLSHELVATSDALIDFMTGYKGNQNGWQIQSISQNRSRRKKTFYLNQELTKVDSVR